MKAIPFGTFREVISFLLQHRDCLEEDLVPKHELSAALAFGSRSGRRLLLIGSEGLPPTGSSSFLRGQIDTVEWPQLTWAITELILGNDLCQGATMLKILLDFLNLFLGLLESIRRVPMFETE